MISITSLAIGRRQNNILKSNPKHLKITLFLVVLFVDKKIALSLTEIYNFSVSFCAIFIDTPNALKTPDKKS